MYIYCVWPHLVTTKSETSYQRFPKARENMWCHPGLRGILQWAPLSKEPGFAQRSLHACGLAVSTLTLRWENSSQASSNSPLVFCCFSWRKNMQIYNKEILKLKFNVRRIWSKTILKSNHVQLVSTWISWVFTEKNTMVLQPKITHPSARHVQNLLVEGIAYLISLI